MRTGLISEGGLLNHASRMDQVQQRNLEEAENDENGQCTLDRLVLFMCKRF